MKLALAALATFASVTASAQFRTADNVNYVILLKENLLPKAVGACASKICGLSQQFGNGNCKPDIDNGVVTANLTTYGASQVEKLVCVDAVSVDRGAQAN